MRAIVNIKLHDLCCGPGLSTQQRFDGVLSRSRQFFNRTIGEVSSSDTGDVAVLVFDCQRGKDGVLEVLYRLCKDFSQEYIAVLFCDGQGRVVGPNADLFGPFKNVPFAHPAYFSVRAAA